MRNRKHRLTAFLLAAAFLLAENAAWLPAMAEEASGDVIHIHTADDFANFASRCELDTWSQGKTVYLEEDIDLSTLPGLEVPTFGGTFEGQNHTLNNLSFTSDGSARGLFRYVQENATVRELNVTGKMMPEGSRDQVGGLVGSNSGTIENCSFNGAVSGADHVGGIAGENTVTGMLLGCKSEGSILGEHFVGGIVGINAGIVKDCENSSRVNTTSEDSDIDIASLTLQDITNTEAAASITDIGGIAGTNSGVIRACRNFGMIGYYHIGYNVGGIAGSQIGYIEGCVNSGTVSGRKEVGGIVGQMEPDSVVDFSEDTLQKVSGQLQTLQGLMNKLNSDASGTSDAFSSQVSALESQVSNAQNALQALLGSVHDNVSVGTTTTDISDYWPTPIPTVQPTAVPGSTATPEITVPTLVPLPTAAPGSTATPEITVPTLAPLPTAAAATPEITVPTLAPLPTAAPVPSGTAAPAAETSASAGGLMLQTLAARGENNRLQVHRAAEAALPQAGSAAVPLTGTAAISLPTGLPDDVQLSLPSSLPSSVDVPSVSVKDEDAILAAERNFSGNVTSALSSAQALTSAAAGYSQTLIADVKAVSDQLNLIGNTLAGAGSVDTDNLVQDISDSDTEKDTTGKVYNCVNLGAAKGDLNVGGIAGAMAMENDLDPEDDISISGDSSLNFSYRTRVVIRGCRSNGTVLAKKQNAGGIVGQEEMGSVIGSFNSGTVTVESGKAAGGVAGESAATIRESSAKCHLSAQSTVGGIAGIASTVNDCRAMIEIDKGSEFLGAIAGRADDISLLSGNTFAAGAWAGADGVSYAGRAEPMEYESFIAQENIPDDFRTLTLTFIADDIVAASVACTYGEALDEEDLPAVPEKEGYHAEWAPFDYSSIKFDETIEAVYSPYSNALESTQKRGEQPILLAEGSFGAAETFALTEMDAELAGNKALELWQADLPDDGVQSHVLRYLPPQDAGTILIYVRGEDGFWEKTNTVQNGSYLEFTAEGNSIVFCAKEKHNVPWLLFAAAGGAALLLFAALILHRKKKKKETKKPDKVADDTGAVL